ncbi:MAG: BRO family protein [Eikenella sp.]|nr:BRO family protein [Eikenella sp.]
MNNLSIFTFQAEQSVRVEIINNEPWFCLKDVAEILEIENGKASRFNLKEAGVHKMYLRSGGQNRELTFINEPNLYRVIFRSNKPEAVKFQDWIFEEVIPAIRQTGRYELHLDRWLNEWEREQIRAAVKARCERTGESSQAVYRKLHAFMDIPSYEQIGATQFQTALNFLASMANAPEVFRRPEAPQLRNLKAALHHGLYCAEFIYRHSEALRGLNRRLAAGIHDHATAACACIRSVAEQVRQPLPGGQFFEYYPWDGDCEAKRRYLELCI